MEAHVGVLSDMDKEMKKRTLHGAIVLGDSTTGNPELYYVVGARLPRGGIFFKKRGQEPVLVVSNIDVGSAEKGRIKNIETYSDYGYERLVQRLGRDRALIAMYHRILKKQRAAGRIGLFGRHGVSSTLKLVDRLRRLGHRIVGEKAPTLLDVLRGTKDTLEIEKIRAVGDKTQRAVERTLNLLRHCRRVGDGFKHEDKKLTVGVLKSYIRRFLVEENLIPFSGTIFAVGPKSADPHHPGDDNDPLLPDEPIVFDIFPQQDGAYCFDLTRTYVIGTASSEIQKMHESVLEAQLLALDTIREGVAAKEVMKAVCAHFTRQGYKTVQDLFKGDKQAQTNGFIHSLGHGVGLTIGERPSLSLSSEDILKRGNVTTVEPGLYRPGVGGVRIEDVVVVTEKGIQNLTHLDKNLEV